MKHVSQAREYETFKQLPKFDHVSLAVIHPTSRQRRRAPVKPTPDMEKEINVSPARLNAKLDTRKEIPESLSRPPMTSSSGGGGGGRSSSNKNKRPRAISVHFGGTQPRFALPKKDGDKDGQKRAKSGISKAEE